MVKCAYVISPRVRDPIIKRGESCEIEIYITGYGEPKDNKLQIFYSSPNFVNPQNPGYAIVSGKSEKAPNGKFLFKLGASHTQRHDLNKIGAQISFSSAVFKTRAEYEHKPLPEPGHIPMILTEAMVDDIPPVMLHINTKKDVEPGDYTIHFAFPYSADGTNYEINEKEVNIHVTSWAERHITSTTIIGIILSLVAIFSGVIGYLLGMK